MTSGKDHRDEQTLRLARRFVEEQGIPEEDAVEVARKIGGSDNDIWSAALRWLENGTLSDEPEVEGQTPRSLTARFNPSVAFTALMALREDPEGARSALRHMPRDRAGRPQA